MKVLLHEKSFHPAKARGILDRCLSINSIKGFPQYNIKEIMNPQGDPVKQNLLDEITDMRKLLLIYRIIHFKDTLPEIEVGLDGRDRELTKPMLQLFYGLGASGNIIKEIEGTLDHFIRIKNNIKENSIEALIYPVIVNSVSEYGTIISSNLIWQLIILTIERVFGR